MTETSPTRRSLTVGQLARLVRVTVRTLHHYDALGLLSPSERSEAGYRLYSPADVTRMQHVIVYRRLGFSLEEIALLLDDATTGADVLAHLRRQRAAVTHRLDELRGLVKALDRALEAEMSGVPLTKEEQRALFGEGFNEAYAQEAEQRWGDTEAWKQSRARAAKYTREDWIAIKAETDGHLKAFAQALREGDPATSERAMDVAEEARLFIHRRFYPCSHGFHRNLAELYVSDPRFTRTYEDVAPGLATYVHDAIVANAERGRDEARTPSPAPARKE
jgi:DNA-binding transcriptional MerR regulator